MSRLIVKNLPKDTTEKGLRDLFSQKGTVTECSLKYRDGQFRRFATVGFVSQEEAEQAQKYFNRTYIKSAKIQVEVAEGYGKRTLKPWSSLKRKGTETDNSIGKERKPSEAKKKKEDKDAALLGELHSDPGFKEFLAVYDPKSHKPSDRGAGDKGTQHATEGESDNADSSHDSDSEEEQVPKKKQISDLEFLSTQQGDFSEDELEEEEKEVSVKQRDKKTGKEMESTKLWKSSSQKFMLKMKGLPKSARQKTIEEFFLPLKVKVRIPKNSAKKLIGIAFIECQSEKDLVLALAKNKNFIQKKKVYLNRVVEEKSKTTSSEQAIKPKPWEQKEKTLEKEADSISESGRLFVRNLAYQVKEEELEELFKKYGPCEVHVPVDRYTKKNKGIAHVTFMMPQHAVQAFTQLDYSDFMGRLLHILPGQEREQKFVSTETSSYKRKKEEDKKKLANKPYNWNSLFLSADAVAEAMSKKYGVDKSKVLDDDGKSSLAVRMALGETQLVHETRQFLIDNGVALDSFSQAAGARSKTVMLVKHLRPGTQQQELQDLFSKRGSVKRVLLPPHGGAAIVEFQEPSEARAALFALTGSLFKDRPLYLEWAPMAVFSQKDEQNEEQKEGTITDKTEENEELSEEDKTKMKSRGKQKEKKTKEEKRKKEKKEDKLKKKDDNVLEDVKDESDKEEVEAIQEEELSVRTKKVKRKAKTTEDSGVNVESEEESEAKSTLFVKNLNFNTLESALKELFSEVGGVKKATVATKLDAKNPGKRLSMGFGFVEFKKAADAMEALKKLQKTELDGHQLELSITRRETVQPKAQRRRQDSKQKGSTKIVVKNLPFSFNNKELRQLFKVFAEPKFVRMPLKVGERGNKGYAFVDFHSQQDAKRAFDALCHSTHLNGRRLVLEWAQMEESLEDIQRKTAKKYGGPSKQKVWSKHSIMESLE